MLAFLKRELEWLKGAWQSAGDEVALYWSDLEIKDLNDQLDDAVGEERRELIIELELASDSYNAILARIKAREAKNQQAAVTH